MRTRIVVSLIRKAILVRCICKVLNSAIASGRGWGTLLRTFSSILYEPICSTGRTWWAIGNWSD